MAKNTKQRKAKQQRGKRTSDWRPAFLAAFALTGVVLDACKAVPVNVTTVWRERKTSAEFAVAYEEARLAGSLTLEREATRRAIEGVRRLKFYEGVMITVPSGNMLKAEDGTEYPEMVPYVEHEYSDALLALLLKRQFPQEYRERPPEVNVTAHTTANVTVVIPSAQLAEYQAREKLALEALLGGRN